MFPTKKIDSIKKYGDNSLIIVVLLQFGISLKLLNFKSRKTNGCSKICNKVIALHFLFKNVNLE